MDAMATAHEDDGLRRRKHVFTTDGTIAVRRSFDASMSLADGDGDARAAGLGPRVKRQQASSPE